MVKITGAIQTKKIELPSYPGSEIVIKVGLTVADQRDIVKKYPNITEKDSSDAISATIEMIVKSIMSRNFEGDVDGEILPITVENIVLFPSEDFAFLAEQISQKKT